MATIREIAAAAGVSPSAVSKALRGTQDINSATAERIRKCAAELGYDTGKLRARQAGKTIGVVFMELSSEYYNGIFENFRKYAEDAGYDVIIMLPDFSSVEDQEKCVLNMIDRNVGGILFLTEAEFDLTRIADSLKDSGTELVMITFMTCLDFCDTINVNHEHGVRMALEHLFELGHRKIAFVGENNTQGRERAFRKIMKEERVEVPESYIVRSSERGCEGGYAAAKKLLRLPPDERPTACFAAYDQLAYGVIKAYTDAGLKIPDDLSVIGTDNNRVSQFMTPSLSSIKMPVEEVGKQAAKILLSRMRGDRSSYRTIYLSPRLCKRETTAELRSEDTVQ